MGTSKRKNKPAPQLRSRTTRSRGKPLANPAENTQLLTEQLRALGLYAAPTLGDGNCLFRALSDQYYGTPSYHLKLRQDICNWIETYKHRYAPFVDDERGLDVHLQCMRQQATYGGHLELSAFAHMMRRNVKVIQPGLVYVIEWESGGDFGSEPAPSSSTSSMSVGAVDDGKDEREKRRARRERKRSEQAEAINPPPNTVPGPIYVAYHDWEHFSSIRNLRGPHTGLPNVHEVPEDAAAPPLSPAKKKPASKAKSKPASKATPKTHTSALAQEESPSAPKTPSQIPLPDSRTPSPDLQSQASAPPFSLLPTLLPALPATPRSYRSPKRSFDESSASSESSQGVAKRAKSASRHLLGSTLPMPESTLDAKDTDDDAQAAIDVDEVDVDTPDLSASVPGSPASSSSLSSVPSPEPSPPPPPVPAERPLTRRQRKQLGLPKPRAALGVHTRGGSAGKIVIPGGRYKRAGDDDEEEWQKNGTGRVDVRGFRELKI